VITVHDRAAPRPHIGVPDAIAAVAARADEGVFYTGGSALWIAERDRATAAAKRIFAAPASGVVSALAFDPAGERLAGGEQEGRLHVWSLGDVPRRIGLLDGTSAQRAGTIRAPGEPRHHPRDCLPRARSSGVLPRR
jgi:hypothetical protein